MSFWSLLLVALGLSADAFAVAVGTSLATPRLSRRGALLIAAAFGASQGLMPLLGWVLGAGLERWVASVDHWVAFGLLAAVGGRMLRDALRGDEEPAGPEPALVTPDGRRAAVRRPGLERTAVPPRALLVLALATSIDALAVGVGFALLDVAVLPAAALIALVTSAVALAGVAVGRAAGDRWRRPAEVAGGLVLLAIGGSILLEHLVAV